MDIELDELRNEFRFVTRWMIDADGCSEADVAEMGDAIKSVIDRNDQDMLLSWKNWLKKEAAKIRAYIQSIRDMEARIREEGRLRREI